jgi:hypothetical protein
VDGGEAGEKKNGNKSSQRKLLNIFHLIVAATKKKSVYKLIPSLTAATRVKMFELVILINTHTHPSFGKSIISLDLSFFHVDARDVCELLLGQVEREQKKKAANESHSIEENNCTSVSFSDPPGVCLPEFLYFFSFFFSLSPDPENVL